MDNILNMAAPRNYSDDKQEAPSTINSEELKELGEVTKTQKIKIKENVSKNQDQIKTPKGFEACGVIEIPNQEKELFLSDQIDHIDSKECQEDQEDQKKLDPQLGSNYSESICLNLSSIYKNCTHFLYHEFLRSQLKENQHYINKFKDFNERNKRNFEYSKLKTIKRTMSFDDINIKTYNFSFDINLNINGEDLKIPFNETLYIDNKTIVVNNYQLQNILLIIKEFDIDKIIVLDEEIKEYNALDNFIKDKCNMFWSTVIGNDKNVLKCFDECSTCLYKDICEVNDTHLQFNKL